MLTTFEGVHNAGSADGNAQQARFNGPSSIVFDPVNDVMYVADQDNDAIRRITRSGDVTTLFGRPGMRESLVNQGVEWTDQLASRAVSVLEVNASQATLGVRPDIYMPQVIRVDSKGNIILLEVGFGAIRRINPSTGQTKILGEVQQKHQEFSRGWAWLDVDRYGNSGPKDGIYWCKFVSTLPGEIFNEVFSWLPPEGGESIPLFPKGNWLYPDGWGRLEQTNAPHYPWLVAVDPRGSVLLSGGGEHGVTRLRVQKDDDPIEASDYWLGRITWKTGSDSDASYAANSFALKYGYDGHNYLGFTDAWDLADATDDELLSAFDVPQRLRDDGTARRHWLEYIKPNTHRNDSPVEPPDGIPTLELDSNSWRQISLPCDPGENNTVTALFGDDNLGSYGTDWIMWAFDSQSVNTETPLVQGAGYWIIQYSGNTRELDMPANCAATPRSTIGGCPADTGCFAIPITGRAQDDTWQIFGYPFAYSGNVSQSSIVTSDGSCAEGCAFGSAEANLFVAPELWTYDGNGYTSVGPDDVFTPWSVYWALGRSAASESDSLFMFWQEE